MIYCIKNIETIINNKVKENIFDAEELKVSINSKYYKHIDFSKIM